MGNTIENSSKYVMFEDVLRASGGGATIINTLPETNQSCLIYGTVPACEEETHINNLLSGADTTIIIYGENSADTSVERKYNQLRALGFSRVFIYRGGMFEWILLQNIYGSDKIPTTFTEKDILRFSGHPQKQSREYARGLEFSN